MQSHSDVIMETW